MFEDINSYIRGVTIASILVSVMMTIIPKGTIRTVIGLAAGVLMVITLLTPLMKLQHLNIADIIEVGDSRTQVIHEEFSEKQDKLLKQLIENKTSAYILTKAQALGVNCQVTVICNEQHIPTSVTIIGSSKPAPHTVQQLAQMITSDCGITAENQTMQWTLTNE